MVHEDLIENNPELNGKFLGTITGDFVKVADLLKEASYQIRVRGFTDFPIFLISKTEISIGRLLYGRSEMDLNWNYYASFLDEFREIRLIEDERMEDFRKVYKNPDEFCCLFVVDPDFMKFVFIPYPED